MILVAWLMLVVAQAFGAPPEANPAEAPTASPDEASPDEASPEELPVIEGPAVVEYVEAPFPPQAQQAGVEGTVRVLIELDETGKVVEASVPEPIGYGFDEAALQAVRAMTFRPARTEAGPVGVVFAFDYGFVYRAPEPEPTPEPAALPVNVSGIVKEMGTKNRIEGALVVLVDTDYTTKTNEQGQFAFRGVPDGEYTIRVLHVGHLAIEEPLAVTKGQGTQAKLWLRAEKYAANEVVGVYEVQKQEVTQYTLSLSEIQRIPGTFGDPVKVIQTLPGAARSPFGTGFLILRGANPEDSGVYVDGIRLPIIYHLTGTTSVLQPEIVEAVDYLPGGYGAQFGRTQGGTINIRTKNEFPENKITVGADILDAQVQFQGSFPSKKGDKDSPRHGISAGVRRSYIDAFIPILTSNASFSIRPYYWDYQLKYVAPTKAGTLGSVFVYGFEDSLTFSTPEDQATGSDEDDQGDLGLYYSSHRIVGTYNHTFSDRLTFSVVPSYGYDNTTFNQGSSFRVSSKTHVLQLRSELSYTPHPAIEIVPGLDFIGGWINFDFRSTSDGNDGPNDESETTLLDGNGNFWNPDPYLKLNLRPLRDRDRLLITPSIRMNNQFYVLNGSLVDEQTETRAIPSLDPRLAVRFRATKSTVIKGGTGLYHQPPQPFETLSSAGGNRLGYERSWNSSLGVEQQLTQALQVSAEAFYRSMTNQIVQDEDFSASTRQTSFANSGFGRAYGLEVILRHLPKNNFFGWISYTLSRSERKDTADQDWYPFDFDQTHIFSAQAGYDLPKGFAVSTQIQYVTGNPQTPFQNAVTNLNTSSTVGIESGDTNSDRLPGFFQWSVRGDKLFTFKRWQLKTYLELLNVVRGLNPEFTIYQYDFRDQAYVRGLPFIPNIGIEAVIYL